MKNARCHHLFFYGRWSLALLLALIGLAGTGRPAAALALRPAVTDVQGLAGQTLQTEIFLTNDEAQPRTFFLSIQTFIARGEDGQQEFLPPSETKGLPRWLYVAQPSVILNSGETRRVPLTIHIPADAMPGAYQAVVFFSTQPPSAAQDGRVVIGARTGSLLFLTVDGPQHERAKLVEFSLTSAKYASHLPLTLLVRVMNQGSSFLFPAGHIMVQNVWGRTTADIPLNPYGLRVLPQSIRRFTASWQRSPAAAGQSFWDELGQEVTNFAIGPYRLSLIPGGALAHEPTMALRVFIWPWRLTLMLLALIATVCLLLSAYRRRLLGRLGKR